MIKIKKIYTPNNIEELIDILSHEEKVYFLSGGTDLLIRAKDDLLEERCWIETCKLSDLKNIYVENDNIYIGSLCTHSDLINSEIIKTNIAGLQYAVSTIGSVQMRNMATIGGNIANASPAGDSIPMLMVLDTKITTLFECKIYNYDIINFFTGPGKSQLKSKEFILKISIPITQGYTQKFYKLGQREGIAISKINLAVNYKIEDSIISDIKISLGAVAPTVVRARKTEEFLINTDFH